MGKIHVRYSGHGSLRAVVVLWSLKQLTPLHAMLNPHREAWNLQVADFFRFEDGSLGRALGTFYRKEGVEPVAKAERHDVFHVLLDYGTDVIGETGMQFFLWGNGKPSFFTITASFAGAVLFPGNIGYFLAQYRRGRKASPVGSWDFRQLLPMQTGYLKQRIFH